MDGSTDIADGTGSVDFGSTNVATPVSKTFTIQNTGNDTLTLNNPIGVPAGFTVTSSFGATTLAAGASTTFTVRMDAASGGTPSGQISFTSDDADEATFNFNISGTVLASQVMDDGDAGFTATGGWGYTSAAGTYQGDVLYAAAGDGSVKATWTFSSIASGQYRVSATWLEHANRATDAPYTIKDGASTVGNAAINQELAPNDLTESGVNWGDLGIVSISGNTLVVELTNSADQYVIADAIRIEWISAAPLPSGAPLPDADVVVAEHFSIEASTHRNQMATAARRDDESVPTTGPVLTAVATDRGALEIAMLSIARSTHPLPENIQGPTFGRSDHIADATVTLDRDSASTISSHSEAVESLATPKLSYASAAQPTATQATPVSHDGGDVRTTTAVIESAEGQLSVIDELMAQFETENPEDWLTL